MLACSIRNTQADCLVDCLSSCLFDFLPCALSRPVCRSLFSDANRCTSNRCTSNLVCASARNMSLVSATTGVVVSLLFLAVRIRVDISPLPSQRLVSSMPHAFCSGEARRRRAPAECDAQNQEPRTGLPLRSRSACRRLCMESSFVHAPIQCFVTNNLQCQSQILFMFIFFSVRLLLRR